MKRIISILLAVIMAATLFRDTPLVFADSDFDSVVNVSSKQYNLAEKPLESDLTYSQADGQIINSSLIVDYGNNSYEIMENGDVVLRNWQENTITGIGITNATALAIDGDILLVSICGSDSTEIYLYSIRSKSIDTLATINHVIGDFSLADNIIYYINDAKIHSLDLTTEKQKIIYSQQSVDYFYLYSEDIIAFTTVPTEDNTNTSDDDLEYYKNSGYDPYKLLFLANGEIEYRQDYESNFAKFYVTDVNYSVAIGGIKIPFSDYPSGSYWTTNGKACVNHDKCKRYYYDSIKKKNVDLLSWQCMSFAHHVFYRLFGVLDRPNNSYKTPVSNKASGTISENYLKSIFGSTILPGANIRTKASSGGYGHNLIYMGHDNNYVYTYEGNMDNRCRVSVIRRTWAEMVAYLKTTKPGIEYIHMPNNYPGGTVNVDQSAPTITASNCAGGREITIAGPSGSTLCYTRNGGEIQEVSGNTTTFKITATETITAYAKERTGYNRSPVNTQIISVTKLSAPVIETEVDDAGILVTMSTENGGTIYYTTDETVPSASSIRYTGGFRLTENTAVKAVSIQDGCITSDVAQKNITKIVPGVPSPMLFDTNSKIAAGDSVQIKWDKVEYSTRYRANLYCDGNIISTLETGETSSVFVLENAGQYQIKVCAINFAGFGSESAPVSVEAVGPSKITFKDWDDTVIEEQTVKYNTVLDKYPNPPAREGYNFSSWSVPSGTKITADTVITAIYTIKTYNVMFFDVNGTTQLGVTQRIQYDQAATPPENYTLATGYKFAGWSITQDSVGTSLERVDGNIKAIATQTWENPKLPVVAKINKAYREESGDSYIIEVSFTNTNTQNLKGRIVTVLKTKEGKMVAGVSTDVSGKLGIPDVEQTEKITVNYNGRASLAEVVIVGLDDTNTGGAYSETITSDITAESEWSDWSDWSTVAPPSEADQTETKTQYRARSYEYTTSSTSTLSGWTLYDTTSVMGTWTAWSQTQPTSQSGREIETKSVPATYKTQWNYWGFKDSAGRTHFCAGAGAYVYGTSFSRIESGWRDTTIAGVSMSQTCSGGMGACHHTGRIYCYTRYGSYYWVNERKVQTGGGYNEWRYRDPVYTYHYRRFDNWSDWSDIPVSGNETETITLYRYRNEVAINDPKAGEEDAEYETYTTTGNLTGLDVSFTGRKATILVYEKLNDDPTRPKLQYVGQTTIGENNSYDFTFKPKGKPTLITGDFIVTLALEGATRVINVDVIEAPKHEYTVTFISDGKVIETRSVKEGEIAVPPPVPKREGYTFIGWSDNTTNIDSTRSITAQWQINEYSVFVVDFTNDSIEMLPYTYGSTIGSLKTPECEGKIFKGWYIPVGEEKQFISETDIIKGNTVIIADWESTKYTVTFVGKDNEVVSTQQVDYGSSAELPPPLTSDDMIFKGWSTDVEWWKVTRDLIVTPIFMFSGTAETPTIGLDFDNDGEFSDVVNIITLNSSTENATIYYSIEGKTANQMNLFADDDVLLPTDLNMIYSPDTPIIITGDVKITMMAVSEGMNDSDIVVIDIPFVNPVDELPIQILIFANDVIAFPNAYVDIPVYISGTTGVADIQLGLKYDKDNLTLVSSTQGDAFQPGVINGVLTTLKFQAAANIAPGDYMIEIVPSAKGSDNNPVSIDSTVMTVRIPDSVETGLYTNGIKSTVLAAGNIMVVREIHVTTTSAVAVLVIFSKYHLPIRTITSNNIISDNNGGSSVVAVGSITQSEIESGCYVKSFVWDGLDSMKPISNLELFTSAE